MRTAIYCRISRDPHGTELGVKRQLADVRALCEREEFDVIAEFIDDDRSAYSGKRRPGFEALRDLVAGGNVDVVVAWHPDRLTRHPRELEDLIDLLERTGTTVRTCQTGEYDLSTPSGRMGARIVGAVARHESEHKSARIRRKHTELAEAGKVAGGGARPYGYEMDRLTLRPDEADTIREMADRVLAGDSVRSLCTDLNRRRSRTTSGSEWYPTAIVRLLRSPRIAGLREHHGVTTEAVWPEIVDRDTYYRLAAMLSDPTRSRHSGGRPRRLLTGLLVCGRCGNRLESRNTGAGVRGYVCGKGPGLKGCAGLRVIAEPLEDLITAAVLHRLDTPDLAAALAPPDDDSAILAELRAAAERAAELAEMFATGEVSRSDWAAASAALTKRRAALEDDLRTYNAATTVPTIVGTATIGERWPELPDERRRAIIDTVIDSIIIGPANGRSKFDPDRVTVSWRA